MTHMSILIGMVLLDIEGSLPYQTEVIVSGYSVGADLALAGLQFVQYMDIALESRDTSRLRFVHCFLSGGLHLAGLYTMTPHERTAYK